MESGQSQKSCWALGTKRGRGNDRKWVTSQSQRNVNFDATSKREPIIDHGAPIPLISDISSQTQVCLAGVRLEWRSKMKVLDFHLNQEQRRPPTGFQQRRNGQTCISGIVLGTAQIRDKREVRGQETSEKTGEGGGGWGEVRGIWGCLGRESRGITGHHCGLKARVVASRFLE